MRKVRFAESKPNYGKRGLDPVLEELSGNKLELAGLLLDGLIKEIGLSISSRLRRSRMTGLMEVTVMFMPYHIFRHLWVLMQGYGATAETSQNAKKINKSITLMIKNPETAEKIWSPGRFAGENYLKR